MFRRPCFLLSLFLCWNMVTAFAPPATFRTTTTQPNVSLNMSDEIGEPSPIESLPWAMKLVGVLAIKTAKDIVNYPPMLLDQALREQQDTELPQTNPFVMLAKFIGVLVFKTFHDAVYFPTLWTDRMIRCQSLEECEVE